MPKSDPTLVTTGFVLSLIGALVALIIGLWELISGVPGLNLQAIAIGIIYFALGLLSLMFTFQVRRRYDSTKAILLLVFAILFLILWFWGTLGIFAAVSGLLMLLGVIILMIGRG